MEIKITTETKNIVNVDIESEEMNNADKNVSKGVGKRMIIGVGGAGYHMLSTIRREAMAEAFKNAKYVFADTDEFYHGIIVEEQKEDYVFLDLKDINLDNDILSDFFQDIEKVYIVAGMGGKTGTKWVPILSQYLKREGIKSIIAIVSEPFLFEGDKKINRARKGIAEIADSRIDRLITMKCEELLLKPYSDINFFNAFIHADKAILHIVEEISKETDISDETTQV